MSGKSTTPPTYQNPQATQCYLPPSESSTINGSQFLTPDALMLYCENKLRDLDGQIQKAFSGQQMYNADQQALGDLANGVGIDHDLDFKNPDDFKKAWDTYQQMEATADKLSDPAAKAALQKAAGALHDKLQAAYSDMVKGSGCPDNVDDVIKSDADIDNFYGNGVNDLQGNPTWKKANDPSDANGKIAMSEWQGDSVEGAIKNCQQDINSSSELAMINLQSLMSQRQESIQLCTNLVQSLGDQCNKIAQNVGH